MITVMAELTPAEIAQRRARKEMLLLQAEILCRVYDAGKLREMLNQLKASEQPGAAEKVDK